MSKQIENCLTNNCCRSPPQLSQEMEDLLASQTLEMLMGQLPSSPVLIPLQQLPTSSDQCQVLQGQMSVDREQGQGQAIRPSLDLQPPQPMGMGQGLGLGMGLRQLTSPSLSHKAINSKCSSARTASKRLPPRRATKSQLSAPSGKPIQVLKASKRSSACASKSSNRKIQINQSQSNMSIPLEASVAVGPAPQALTVTAGARSTALLHNDSISAMPTRNRSTATTLTSAACPMEMTNSSDILAVSALDYVAETFDQCLAHTFPSSSPQESIVKAHVYRRLVLDICKQELLVHPPLSPSDLCALAVLCIQRAGLI